MTADSRNRAWSVLAAVLLLVMVAAWWLWPVDDIGPIAPKTAVPATTGTPIAPAVASGEQPLARVAADEAVTAADAPIGFAQFPFTVTLRYPFDEEYRSIAARFGPPEAGVRPYETKRVRLGRREVAWRGRTASAELVFDSGHLRRVVVASQCAQVVELGKQLTNPRDLSGWETTSASSLDAAFGAAFWEAGGESTWVAGFIDRFDDDENDAPGYSFRSNPNEAVARLTGTIRTTLGRPAVGCTVFAVRSAWDQPTATTDEHGRFAFASLPIDHYAVHVRSDADGSAEVPVDLTADLELDIKLTDGASLRGRVNDPAGKPVAKSRILWWTADGAFRNETLTEDDGTFALRNLPARVGNVWACVPGYGVAWPVAGRSVNPGEDVALTLDPTACGGDLQLRVTKPAGIATTDCTARMWQQESGLGIAMERPEFADGSLHFRSRGIPRGAYAIELLSPGFGVVQAGLFLCDGESTTALDLVLPPAAHVVIRLDPAIPLPPASRLALLRRGTAVDLRIEDMRPVLGEHRLVPGDYAVVLRSANGTRHTHAFAIGDAGQTTVTLR